MKQKAVIQKIFALMVCLCTVLHSDAQTKMPTAGEVLKTACAQAAKEGKNVLLIFHASWCGWCRKMDASLQDKKVQPLIDAHYVTAHLTVYESKDKKELEHAGALDFLTRHGGADQGLPYWMVLDKGGNLLADSQYERGENSGCPASEAEVAYLISVLKKTSFLKEEQLEVVSERFKMNKN